MNKIEFIQKVAKKSGATKKDASIIVNVIADIITKTLADGDILQWKGLGTFKTTAQSSNRRQKNREGTRNNAQGQHDGIRHLSRDSGYFQRKCPCRLRRAAQSPSAPIRQSHLQ